MTAGINYKFESGIPDSAVVSPEPRKEPSEDDDLAKKSQNPIADLVSVPFQSNTNFNAAPFGRTQEVLNIQPVVPMHVSEDWNMISRTIIPVISQPNPIFDSNTNGIGDITQSLFFSPVHSGALIWGAGPVFTVPSATDPILGTGHFLLGPTVVLLTTPGHWVIGVLLNNQWSVDGNPLRPPVNSFLAQPFINYNFAHGYAMSNAAGRSATSLLITLKVKPPGSKIYVAHAPGLTGVYPHVVLGGCDKTHILTQIGNRLSCAWCPNAIRIKTNPVPVVSFDARPGIQVYAAVGAYS